MIKLFVEGMTCNHCAAAVSNALAKVQGVDRVVEVSLERGEAVVDGRPDIEALVAAVRDEGYNARPAE
jgi:copper chaperone